MAPLILYEHPLSPYAQKVKIALREKAVAFEARLPEGIGTGATGGGFSSANPRGEVPALVHGDLAIFDSTIILEYIEDVWPSPPLLPASPAGRARVRMIEDVMDTQFEAITWGLGEINFFKRAEGVSENRDRSARRGENGTFLRLARRPAWRRTLDEWRRVWLGRFVGDPLSEWRGRFRLCAAGWVKLADWAARTNARASVAATRREAEA